MKKLLILAGLVLGVSDICIKFKRFNEAQIIRVNKDINKEKEQ